MIESAARVERITTDSTPRSAYHWEVPQKPVAVNLPYEMVGSNTWWWTVFGLLRLAVPKSAAF